MNALAKRSEKLGMDKALSSWGLDRVFSPWAVFDGLFDESTIPSMRTFNTYSPVTDENDKEYLCEFDMPGLSKSDIDIGICLLSRGIKKVATGQEAIPSQLG